MSLCYARKQGTRIVLLLLLWLSCNTSNSNVCISAASPCRLYFLGYEKKEDIPGDPVERVRGEGLRFRVLA
jgi:hypothetical protein